MPRRCRTNDPTYESRIQSALKGLTSGEYKTLAMAAREENIAESTLRDRRKGQPSWKDQCVKRQRLTKEQEDTLFAWVAKKSDSGEPLSVVDIKRYVMKMTGQKPGLRWVSKFLRRHPALKAARPAKLDPKRAKNFNRSVVRDFFNLLELLNTKYDNIPPEHIWNMDEKGIQMGGGRRNGGKKYLFLRRHRNRYRISSDNLELVTVIECVSASGISIPPSFVLSEGPLPDLRQVNNIASVATSPSGWTDNEICQQWFDTCFVKYAIEQRVCSRPIVLIMDGHESHENRGIQRSAYCVEGVDIIILALPSKCTHKLQPLDVAVFAPLQRAWQTHCDNLIYENITINRYNVIQEYMKVHSLLQPETIQKSFEKTGIYPINPNVFNDEDYGPSQAMSIVTDLPDSFPPPMPSSDPAIPTDVESNDSDYVESDSDIDDDNDEMEDIEAEDDGTGEEGYESDDEIEMVEMEGPTETSTMESTAHPSTRTSSVLTILNTIPTPKIVTIREDEVLSHEECLEELRVVRTQLWDMYHHAQRLAAQVSGANAHCTVISQILDQTKLQLENERKKKIRQSAKVKARFITLPELKDTFNKREEELQAQEQAEAEKQAQKNADKAALQAKVTEDAKSRVFELPLTNYKKKIDLVTIACALGLSQDGTIGELTTRIKSHLESHQDLHTDPRFMGLFRARRPRATAIENSTPSNANESSQDMPNYPDIPIDPSLY